MLWTNFGGSLGRRCWMHSTILALRFGTGRQRLQPLPGVDELDRGFNERDQSPSHAPSSRVFGFFAHAAGLKAVERAWWEEFWRAFLELDPATIPLEFLPSPAKSVLDARFASIRCPSPRAMTAAIAATRMFISADTGPMHLASSTPVPTVALFRASNPALYGPLKDQDAVINITENTPQLVARQCQRLWRASLTGSAPIRQPRAEPA
jgi:hypothetical protein